MALTLDVPELDRFPPYFGPVVAAALADGFQNAEKTIVGKFNRSALPRSHP